MKMTWNGNANNNLVVEEEKKIIQEKPGKLKNLGEQEKLAAIRQKKL